MTLAGVGHQPEGSTSAKLQVRHLQAVEHPANDHGFYAPVELEGYAQLEAHRSERIGRIDYRLHSPAPEVVGDGALAAAIALGLYLSNQDAAAAPSLLGAMAVGCERLMQDQLEHRELAIELHPLVLWRNIAWRLKSLLDRVARQARALCDLAEGELVARPHAPDLANQHWIGTVRSS